MTRCDLAVDGNALFGISFFSAYGPDGQRTGPHYDRNQKPITAASEGCTRIFDLVAKRGLIPEVPERILVCFDGCPKNDKNRSVKPLGYYEELNRFIHKAIPAVFGPDTSWIAPKHEADDAVATLAARRNPSDNPLYIVSTDKDPYQMIGPGVSYFCLRKKKVIQEEEFLKRIPCASARFLPIFLALAGDSIDNIKGVQKIGKKKAKAIVEKLSPKLRLSEAIDKVAYALEAPRRKEFYEAILLTTLFGDVEDVPEMQPIRIPSLSDLTQSGWMSVCHTAMHARRVLQDVEA